MNRLAQGDRILALLKAAAGSHLPGLWVQPGGVQHESQPGEVPLPAILALSPRIAQHTARITELRHAGYDIRCRSEWVNGERHTFYRLVSLTINRLAAAPQGAVRSLTTCGQDPDEGTAQRDSLPQTRRERRLARHRQPQVPGTPAPADVKAAASRDLGPALVLPSGLPNPPTKRATTPALAQLSSAVAGEQGELPWS